MTVTPDTAFAAAQILAILLVATILDPWARNTATDPSREHRQRLRRTAAWVSYTAKALALAVLLFNMQLVLFDATWEGTRGSVLILTTYFTIAGQSLTLLLAMLNHMGAFGGADDAG